MADFAASAEPISEPVVEPLAGPVYRGPPVVGKRRSLGTTCVTNFYPINFRASGHEHLHIRIFHCYFFDVDADEAIKPREETELKRAIFEARRQDGRQRGVEDALGVKCLEFGGDCAAGLWAKPPEASLAALASGVSSADELVVDVVDRYEAQCSGDWVPAVLRSEPKDGNVMVEIYAPGSFWSERLNRVGPFEVPASSIRPRRWEVFRGEVLHVPDYETLCLYPGQHLLVRARGPGNDEPAGRLILGIGAEVRCEGGIVENEGIVECFTQLNHRVHGLRRYKAEIESIKTLLVACLEGVPDLPLEERSVVLQCFTWIFERAYRHMQMRTLGGRGWYLADEGETYPRPAEGSMDRALPPRVFLYRGYAATAVQVSRGPCLKIDLSVRMIQGQTALSKLSFFRDVFLTKRSSRGLPVPNLQEMDEFLQSQMVGRTCMTRHNHIHYRIKRVCIDMTPMNSFQTEDGETTYLEYFQRRHGITLDKRQPMLHCPFRGKQELYLPAELAMLTGLDEDWRTDREFAQDLWRGLRHDPTEHWRLQSRLADRLASEEEGEALRAWGVEVSREPLRANMGVLRSEPVFFSRYVDECFRKAVRPPRQYEVPTNLQGFLVKPWPEVWTPAGTRINLNRWLVFCTDKPEEREIVDKFIEELEPLVGEVLEADEAKRIIIAAPEVVEVPGKSAEEWVEYLKAYEPPWPKQHTKLMFLVIPDKVRRRDQYYYQLKDLLFFQQSSGVMSQMALTSTLARSNQRTQIWKNLLQQMLIKHGAWMWVISPLPYAGRVVMVVGIDACKQSKESPSIQTLCASTNPYFTTYYTTWRADKEAAEVHVLAGVLLKEAMLHFFDQNGRLPDTLVVYRGGVSESQESALIDGEVYGEDGILQGLISLSEEVQLPRNALDEWKSRLQVSYILVRRGTNARFRTEDNDNLPSGAYIDNAVTIAREEESREELKRYDFYMVSQTYVIGTAKPTLYSVLYNTLSLDRYEIMQLTYRLCSVYMTFSGMVSMPAPLKYAAKLLSLLSKCDSVTEEPRGTLRNWKTWLFFV